MYVNREKKLRRINSMFLYSGLNCSMKNVEKLNASSASIIIITQWPAILLLLFVSNLGFRKYFPHLFYLYTTKHLAKSFKP